MSTHCSRCSCLFAAAMNSKDKNSIVFPDVLLLCMELRHFQEHHLDPYCPAAAALVPHILLPSVHFIPLSRQEAEEGTPLSVLVLAPEAEISNRVYLLLSLSSGRAIGSWPPAPIPWHCYDCWGKREGSCFSVPFLLLHHVTKMKCDTAMSLFPAYNLDVDF